jgi:hypothetical protein
VMAQRGRSLALQCGYRLRGKLMARATGPIHAPCSAINNPENY